MSKLLYLGSFVVGGGIGALTTWILCKKKYEALIEEEIRSVKEEFAKESHIVIVKNEEEVKNVSSKEEINNYKETIKENHYTSYKKALDEVKNTAKEQEDILPYLIEPDEQGESGFGRETLIWYEGDDTLADEAGKIIDLPDQTIGMSNLKNFDDTDVIFVRNEMDEMDYEVIRDPGTFSEAYSNPNYIQTGMDE